MSIKRTVITLGIVAGAGYAAYNLLLTKEARHNLQSTVVNMKDTVASVLDKMQSKKHGDEEASRQKNVNWVESQWNAIGF